MAMLRVSAFVALYVLLGGCSDMCRDTLVARAPSPDSQHDAVLFQRDCGATTGFSTQISILNAGDRSSGAGNAFRADDDHGAARAGDWGGPWAEMKWLSANHLLIRYAARSRLYSRRDAMSGVRITYRTEAD